VTVNDHQWLTERFETHRKHLEAVAYRMLGSQSEADDAVQEAWLRLHRTEAGDIDNLGGWLTTVLARVCLDMLRSRKSRREEPLDTHLLHTALDDAGGGDPEHAVLMADAVGPALLLVLETLSPSERLAFVLHDMFAVSFDDIASIVGRSPTAARQLASRARRRVRGAETPSADLQRQKEVVSAFLAASRHGDFAALLAVLDPNVVLRADAMAVQASLANHAKGAPLLSPEVQGATVVAKTFAGRAQGAQLALIDDAVGAAWAPDGKPRAAFCFTVANGKIIDIRVLVDPAHVRRLHVVLLDS
jgi:RNA polymerase sigma factor (sigma-70 family)